MAKRNSWVLGAITVLASAMGLYLLTRKRRRISAGGSWIGQQQGDDPFAEMIEEGAGLLGQLKAEAVELARKAGLS